MRVLHVIPSLKNGGAERQARQLLVELASRGTEIAVYSRMSAEEASELKEAGVTICAVRADGNYDPRLAGDLIRFIIRWRPTVIQTWLPMMDIIGGLSAKLTRTPYILSERCEAIANPRGFKTSLRQWLGMRAAAVVANNPVGAQGWLSHPTVRVIGNGLNLAAISAATSRTPTDVGRPVLICVARLTAQKNHVKLLEAVALLVKSFPNLRVQLLGDGPDRPTLKTLASSLDIAAHIEFAGFRDDAWAWLKAADVAILLSHFEGTPNAALEAAAAGCPLVISDIPAHRWAFEDADVKFVDRTDAQQIAEAITAILNCPETRTRMAASARAHVAAMTVAANADAYLALYRELEDRSSDPLGLSIEP